MNGYLEDPGDAAELDYEEYDVDAHLRDCPGAGCDRQVPEVEPACWECMLSIEAVVRQQIRRDWRSGDPARRVNAAAEVRRRAGRGIKDITVRGGLL